MQRPKDIVQLWVDAFNAGDAEAIAALYHPDAVNHQVANDPIRGQAAIREMFIGEFAIIVRRFYCPVHRRSSKIPPPRRDGF